MSESVFSIILSTLIRNTTSKIMYVNHNYYMVNKLENVENFLQYHMMIFTFNVIPNTDDLDIILFTRHYNIKYNLTLNNKYI